jgi:DNA-binding NtrC family response regulator
VRDITVDVRIVASTNRDLEAAVRDGAFRRDLFFRLNVVPIVIPPLRQRAEDVEPLARHFLDRMTGTMRRPPRTIGKDALAMLERYGWPGNVRELKNVIERAVILEEHAEILPDHLPDELKPGGGPWIWAGILLPAADRPGVAGEGPDPAGLDRPGNKTRAAALLGLTATRSAIAGEVRHLRGAPADVTIRLQRFLRASHRSPRAYHVGCWPKSVRQRLGK